MPFLCIIVSIPSNCPVLKIVNCGCHRYGKKTCNELESGDSRERALTLGTGRAVEMVLLADGGIKVWIKSAGTGRNLALPVPF